MEFGSASVNCDTAHKFEHLNEKTDVHNWTMALREQSIQMKKQ